MSDEKMMGSLQENVLTLLCFNDTYCKSIRTIIETKNIFENNVYREIAGAAIEFIDVYGEAIKDHLPDELEHILQGDDKRKAKNYEHVLEALFENKDSVNTEYTMSSLNKFIRLQLFKGALVRAVDFMEEGNIDQAEIEMTKGMNMQVVSFDAGSYFSDVDRSLRFFDIKEETFKTGIAVLDKYGIGPTRKELFLWMAPPKRGKSWGLIQLGVNAVMQRKKVLHITLEMSEERVNQRYVQAFLGVSRKRSEILLPTFVYDRSGKLVDVEQEAEPLPLALDDENAKQVLYEKIKRMFSKKAPLLVKQFPTGSLTIHKLLAYLDSLERFEKFTPDEILIDYPDLMKYNHQSARDEINGLYQEIRGIGVERNIAMAAVTQANRSGANIKTMDETHVAEDFRKIANADNVVTINATQIEHEQGLARLFVSNGRNDKDKFTVLVTRNLSMGQFALDSHEMEQSYWSIHDSLASGDWEDKDDNEDEL